MAGAITISAAPVAAQSVDPQTPGIQALPWDPNGTNADIQGSDPGPGAESPDELDDAGFAREAAYAGNAEIALGHLAEGRAASHDVRAFARQMVADHTAVANRLKAIARREHMRLPAGLDPTDQQTRVALTNDEGAAFDRAYIESQIEAHERAVELFEDEAREGPDPAIKQFAADALPTLQHHLAMARTLGDQLQASVDEAPSDD